MTKPISKTEYSQAISAQKSLTETISAIKMALGHIVNKDVIKRLNYATDALNNELFTHNKIIAAVDLQVKSFNPGMVGHAMNRVRVLNDMIRLNKGEISRLQRNYDNRVQESIALRVQVSDHKPLDVAPTSEDHARVAEERLALENELSTIERFLKDGALFDISLLKGTALESLLG